MSDDSPPLKMGTVIGGTGDVNVTNVVNTEKDAQCAQCGKHCTKGQFFTCQSCSKTFCERHFNQDRGFCASCESGNEKNSEAGFLSFLKKTVSDDNKITGPELLKLKKEASKLGLSPAEMNRIIRAFQNKGLRGTTQDLAESAKRLYLSGNFREAGERLAKLSEDNLLEQPELLELYIKIYSVLDPNRLIQFFEECPVESIERYVAEFCIQEDRVVARSILYALRDRNQNDFFMAERIQLCWHLSELEEYLHLAEKSKLLEISKIIKEKGSVCLPDYEKIFHELFDIIDSERLFLEQPSSVSERLDFFRDSIAQRTAKICRQAWERLARTLTKKTSAPDSTDPLFDKSKSDEAGLNYDLLWKELERVRALPDISPQTEIKIYPQFFGTKSKTISRSTALGRDFFSVWGEDFKRFMDVKQFELITVSHLNSQLWGLSSSVWSGWVIVPFLSVKNQTNLDDQPLLAPYPLTKRVVISLGLKGTCKLCIDPPYVLP